MRRDGRCERGERGERSERPRCEQDRSVNRGGGQSGGTGRAGKRAKDTEDKRETRAYARHHDLSRLFGRNVRGHGESDVGGRQRQSQYGNGFIIIFVGGGVMRR